MYIYKVKVDRVIDGDTIDCTIDLGFSIFHKARVRLYGIDTPESRTRDPDEKIRGKLASSFIKKKLKTTETHAIATKLDAKGKFGRVLGVLICDDENVNEQLIQNDLAVEYFGQSKEAIEQQHLENRKRLLEKGAYLPPS